MTAVRLALAPLAVVLFSGGVASWAAARRYVDAQIVVARGSDADRAYCPLDSMAGRVVVGALAAARCAHAEHLSATRKTEQENMNPTRAPTT